MADPCFTKVTDVTKMRADQSEICAFDGFKCQAIEVGLIDILCTQLPVPIKLSCGDRRRCGFEFEVVLEGEVGVISVKPADSAATSTGEVSPRPVEDLS